MHLCGRRYRDRVEDTTEVKVYSNCDEVTLYVDGVKFERQEGAHIFKFRVPLSGVHVIKAVSGACEDEMEIEKTAQPNPSYFMSADKVKNWFEEEEEEVDDTYLSLNSTMAEIKAVPEGAAIIGQMMEKMSAKTAGGMGEGAKIPESMQKIIERQPLKKLLVQGGMEPESETVKALEAALRKLKKAGK